MRLLQCAVLIFIALSAAAETPKEIAKEMNTELVGKGLMLASPMRGGQLKFSDAGFFLGKPDSGTWAAHSGFFVQSVSARASELVLKGKRLLMYFQYSRRAQGGGELHQA